MIVKRNNEKFMENRNMVNGNYDYEGACSLSSSGRLNSQLQLKKEVKEKVGPVTTKAAIYKTLEYCYSVDQNKN